ncbi:flagellar hook-associated protein FlgL [Jeotgalibaca caeni]|uniref:flagellar hook-associated protein FlgL n=1 Tax=Jeotgalibaca caeni TaxID=3028623 RepID=UPI00237DEFEB|nr:flagellar hook-associated protein FlgL [Jeotgalibaca caeni]MDE1548294.1 flagellar hook-associated protein FlgL [Jeotgalibaca caeni]
MRISDQMTSRSYLTNLSRNQQNVQKYHEQLSTMKEVSKPSDNPLLVSQIIDLKTNISQNQQYQTTIEDSLDWTDMQDASLKDASDSLMRISTLVQSAANDTMSSSDRLAVRAEVETEIATFVDALNTNFGGRYIFGGTETMTTPFEITRDTTGEMTGITYHGTEQNLSREIASGVNVSLKTDGASLLQSKDGDIGTYFSEVLSALKNDESEKLGGSLLKKANTSIDQVVTYRSEIGAISNRLESAKTRNESQDLNLKGMLSSKEDIDFAEKYMQFMMEQVAYQSSLQMGTKVLQTTILDYL